MSRRYVDAVFKADARAAAAAASPGGGMVDDFGDLDAAGIWGVAETHSTLSYLRAMKEYRYAGDFVDNIVLPGHTSAGGDSCGKVLPKACLESYEHEAHVNHIRLTPMNCYSRQCNVCFEPWINKEAATITDRLTAGTVSEVQPPPFMWCRATGLSSMPLSRRPRSFGRTIGTRTSAPACARTPEAC